MNITLHQLGVPTGKVGTVSSSVCSVSDVKLKMGIKVDTVWLSVICLKERKC